MNKKQADRAQHEVESSIRSSRALHVMDVFGTVGRALLEEQSKSWLQVWGRVLDGELEPKALLRDATQLWAKSVEGMIDLVAAPASVLSGAATQIPQAVFVVDEQAQAARTIQVRSPVVLQGADAPVSTPLERNDRSRGTLDAHHVKVTRAQGGRALAIELVDLKGKLKAGQYSGLVHIGGRGAPGRPLATIQLFVVE